MSLDPIIQQLVATHAGDPWYGSSRAALLEGISAKHAAQRPVAGAHSIWELVLHMTSWTNEVRRRLAGAPPGEPLEGDWPGVDASSDSAWTAAKQALDDAHHELVAAVRAFPPDHWDKPVGPTRDPALGTGVTMCAMLVGLAQHDAYHNGQLALLRRALPPQ